MDNGASSADIRIKVETEECNEGTCVADRGNTIVKQEPSEEEYQNCQWVFVKEEPQIHDGSDNENSFVQPKNEEVHGQEENGLSLKEEPEEMMEPQMDNELSSDHDADGLDKLEDKKKSNVQRTRLNKLCKQCGKTDFRSLIQYHDHQNKHKGKQLYTCACGRSFYNFRSLFDHRRAHQCYQTDNLVHPKYAATAVRVHLVKEQSWREEQGQEPITRVGSIKKEASKEEKIPKPTVRTQRKHKDIVDIPIEARVCDECGRAGFKNIIEFQDHPNVHTLNAPYKCSCGQTFRTYKAIHLHRQHKCSTPFEGIDCPPYASDALNAYLRYVDCNEKEHSFRMTCEECGLVFRHRVEYYDHLNVHTKEQPYVCSCGVKFRSYQSFQPHRKRSKCSLENSVFPEYARFRIHRYERQKAEKMVNPESVVPLTAKACHLCPKKHFTSNVEYLDHVNGHDNLTLYECTCGTKLRNYKNFLKHHRVLKCPLEGSTYPDYADETIQRKILNEKDEEASFEEKTNDQPAPQRKQPCPTCGRANFHSVVYYHDHFNLHSGARPYMCSCGVRYAAYSMYKVHRKASVTCPLQGVDYPEYAKKTLLKWEKSRLAESVRKRGTEMGEASGKNLK